MSSEMDPLLNRTGINTRVKLKLQLSCKLKYFCLSSKAAILIVLWTAVIGTAYTFIKDVVALLIVTSPYAHTVDVAILDVIPYAALTILMTLYPLSGFFADVYCGRFKIALISLTLKLISFVFLSTASFIAFQMVLSNTKFSFHLYDSQFAEGIILLILLTLTLIFFIIGLAGYQANYIQLGLDQLLEAPNEHLGLFIHHATWAFTFSSILDLPLMNLGDCVSLRKTEKLSLFILLPTTLLIALMILYIITCWKRRAWFFIEPGQSNPYKIVYKVLSFTLKHKYPLRRSAFTYCDDYIPSRIDFAKQRYGGPFTTEEVESVKTLSRILVFLMAIGPVFVLQLPASQYIFPLFSFHAGTAASSHFTVSNCSALKVVTRVVETGGLTALFTNILYPFYIWLVFSVLRRKIPKMFIRLGVGVVCSLLGVFSMLIIDGVGHSMNTTNQHNGTNTQCMFHVLKYNYTLEYNPLNMHWSVLIPPSLFFGIGPVLTTTTTLEFIAAQSPQSMKGLLVGVFFAIQGFIKLIGIIAILPDSLTQPWPLTLPSTISCCFVYLFFILLMGLLGFALFVVTAKKYKYRKRDDIMFYQRDVEEVYTRYLIQAPDVSAADNSNDSEDESSYRTHIT